MPRGDSSVYNKGLHGFLSFRSRFGPFGPFDGSVGKWVRAVWPIEWKRGQMGTFQAS